MCDDFLLAESEPMKLTRCMIPAALAAVFLCLPAAASASPRAVSSCRTVDHWGSYFGAGRTTAPSPTPAAMTFPDPSCVTQVGTSNSTQYALLADGTLWAWGLGTRGELGDGGTVNSPATPVQVKFPPGTVIMFIPSDAMPYDSAMAIDSAGQLWVWGFNKGGELCTGNTLEMSTPVVANVAAPVTLAAGADEHMVVDSAGTVMSCGSNDNGVQGTGRIGGSPDLSPAPVIGLPQGVSAASLVSAFDNAGALLSDGSYWDWGMNTAGQLGDGGTRASGRPVQVSLPGRVTQAAQGGSTSSNGQTLVMLADGSLWAWGSDTWGQLGGGAAGTYSASPVQFHAPPGVSWSLLASGGGTSYAVDTGGGVWAWGWGAAWQIGDGSKRVTQARPVQVDTVTGVPRISATANDVAVAG